MKKNSVYNIILFVGLINLSISCDRKSDSEIYFNKKETNKKGNLDSIIDELDTSKIIGGKQDDLIEYIKKDTALLNKIALNSDEIMKTATAIVAKSLTAEKLLGPDAMELINAFLMDEPEDITLSAIDLIIRELIIYNTKYGNPEVYNLIKKLKVKKMEAENFSKNDTIP